MISAGRGGKIVNIASINSTIAMRNQAHYAASKGGLLMLTKAMAVGSWRSTESTSTRLVRASSRHH